MAEQEQGFGIHDQGDGTAVVTFDGRVAFVVTRTTVPTVPLRTWFHTAGVAVGDDPIIPGTDRFTWVLGAGTLRFSGEPSVEDAAQAWAGERHGQ